MSRLNVNATLSLDLRYGLRQFRRNPGFTLVAVLTLALGIGATTAVFTVFNAVLLRPLPYLHPGELVYVEGKMGPPVGISPFTFNNEYEAWKNRSRTLSTVAAYMYTWANLTGRGEAVRVVVGAASSSFFRLLGVHPVLGRVFRTEEDRPGGPLIAVLSHRLWESRFGGDPSIVGKGIDLDGKSYTVAGVLPADFVVPDKFPFDYALWVPLAASKFGTRPFQFVRVVGRLKQGVSLATANAELSTITQSVLPKALKQDVVLSPWHEEIVSHARHMLVLLLGAVGFLLLIACVNIANLLLVRSADRQKEMAVRMAMGAGRKLIVRQLLTESTLLALSGAIAGLVLACMGRGLLIDLLSPNLPALQPMHLEWRVLGFALGLAVLTGVAFGLAPAIDSSKVPLNESLKEAHQCALEFWSGKFVRDTLLVGETALALLLLVGAGLFFRTFLGVRGLDMGFQSKNVLSISIDLTASKYSSASAQAAFFQELIKRIGGLPGVISVAGNSCPPLGGHTEMVQGKFVAGDGEETNISRVEAETISPDYFQTMQIPLWQGRFFTEADRNGSPSVAIVNKSFARRYCPGQDCLGARIASWVNRNDWLTVVGVVGNARHWADEEPVPEVYIPFLQAAKPYMTILARTAGYPSHWASPMRSQVAAVDVGQAAYNVATLDELRVREIAPRRLNMILFASFAMLGLILASVGIYGVVAYSVSHRTHEIGVRMALGARREDVLRLVVGEGFKLALLGIAIGIAGALALTRFLSSLLYGVKPTDPLTFIAVALILTGVALLASYIPARRATKVDPMIALRSE